MLIAGQCVEHYETQKLLLIIINKYNLLINLINQTNKICKVKCVLCLWADG